jgi:hypothetical protein
MTAARLFRPPLSLCLCLLAYPAVAAACPPADYGRAELLSLRKAQFVVEDDTSRNRLATELLVCTDDPDPAIRDGVVYEGLATWLRSGQLSAETVSHLRSGLLEQLEAAPDPAGFRKPFAALILAEVARTDRIAPAFTPAEREQLVRAAAAYLSAVRDYRGFSATEGWRHGVAHGSDFVLQLVLNPNISAEQVRHMLASIAVQVAPPGEIFYIYGEPGRLARAAFYALRRGDLEASEVQAWLQGIVDPHPLAGWGDAYASQAGLARRHNTLAFLQALVLYAVAAGDEEGTKLALHLLELVGQVTG